MSSIRVTNIEAKADASSPTIDEKVKVTDSQGRVLMQVDGKTSGITTVGINTTGSTFTVDSNNGVTFAGIVTSTGGFSGNVTGNATGLSGTPNITVGIVTGNLTGNVTGTVNSTGVITATSFSGNVTGNVNATGISTFSGGIQVGVTTSITVGSSFIKNNSVGLGETTTTGRNAGISTAEGTIIYNSSLREVQVYKGNVLGWRNIGESFIEATGGVISDYNDPGPGAVYRAHIFSSSGSFDVTAAPPSSNTVDYLVVAGGCGGGSTYPIANP